MIDRGGPRRRLAFRAQRRPAGIDVNDREPARLRAAEPGAGIAEIGPREFAQPDDVGLEFPGRRQIVGLDRDVIKPVTVASGSSVRSWRVVSSSDVAFSGSPTSR